MCFLQFNGFVQFMKLGLDQISQRCELRLFSVVVFQLSRNLDKRSLRGGDPFRVGIDKTGFRREQEASLTAFRLHKSAIQVLHGDEDAPGALRLIRVVTGCLKLVGDDQRQHKKESQSRDRYGCKNALAAIHLFKTSIRQVALPPAAVALRAKW